MCKAIINTHCFVWFLIDHASKNSKLLWVWNKKQPKHHKESWSLETQHVTKIYCILHQYIKLEPLFLFFFVHSLIPRPPCALSIDPCSISYANNITQILSIIKGRPRDNPWIWWCLCSLEPLLVSTLWLRSQSWTFLSP